MLGTPRAVAEVKVEKTTFGELQWDGIVLENEHVRAVIVPVRGGSVQEFSKPAAKPTNALTWLNDESFCFHDHHFDAVALTGEIVEATKKEGRVKVSGEFKIGRVAWGGAVGLDRNYTFHIEKTFTLRQGSGKLQVDVALKNLTGKKLVPINERDFFYGLQLGRRGHNSKICIPTKDGIVSSAPRAARQYADFWNWSKPAWHPLGWIGESTGGGEGIFIQYNKDEVAASLIWAGIGVHCLELVFDRSDFGKDATRTFTYHLTRNASEVDGLDPAALKAALETVGKTAPAGTPAKKKPTAAEIEKAKQAAAAKQQKAELAKQRAADAKKEWQELKEIIGKSPLR